MEERGLSLCTLAMIDQWMWFIPEEGLISALLAKGNSQQRITVEEINGFVLREVSKAHPRIQYSLLPLSLKSACLI